VPTADRGILLRQGFPSFAEKATTVARRPERGIARRKVMGSAVSVHEDDGLAALAQLESRGVAPRSPQQSRGEDADAENRVKKLRPTRSCRRKTLRLTRSRGKKWILILLVVLLLIPVMQVAVVRFINPPLTLPMLNRSGQRDVLERAKAVRLLYRWIGLPKIPEMFLEHLWISEDQRFFQHEGFDWKEMALAGERSGAERETGSRSVHNHEPMRPVDLPLAEPILDQERTGIVLHDLDGNAVCRKRAHPGAVCKT